MVEGQDPLPAFGGGMGKLASRGAETSSRTPGIFYADPSGPHHVDMDPEAERDRLNGLERDRSVMKDLKVEGNCNTDTDTADITRERLVERDLLQGTELVTIEDLAFIPPDGFSPSNPMTDQRNPFVRTDAEQAGKQKAGTTPRPVST
jgi:hypothetical protein